MANGNETISAFKTIMAFQDKGKQIPIELKDDLLFGALVELFQEQKRVREELASHVPWVKVFKWLVITLGPVTLISAGTFVWAILTHQFVY